MRRQPNISSDYAGKLMHRGADIMELAVNIPYGHLDAAPRGLVIGVARTEDKSNIRAVDRLVTVIGGSDQTPRFQDVTTRGDVQLYGKTLLQSDGVSVYVYTKTNRPLSPPAHMDPEGITQTRAFAGFLEGANVHLSTASVSFTAGKVSLASLIVECRDPADKENLDRIYDESVILRHSEGPGGGQGEVLLSNGLGVNIMSSNLWVPLGGEDI